MQKSNTSGLFDNFFGYYHALEEGLFIPAIFQRLDATPTQARLYVAHPRKAGGDIQAAIKIAQADLARAIKMVEPIQQLVPGTGPLLAALFKQDYAVLGTEAIEIDIPSDIH